MPHPLKPIALPAIIFTAKGRLDSITAAARALKAPGPEYVSRVATIAYEELIPSRDLLLLGREYHAFLDPVVRIVNVATALARVVEPRPNKEHRGSAIDGKSTRRVSIL
ncbi:hypothetical protein O1611_g6287 [Lasiodiplodia mahajangana]|uniref:Uncharacterized protein n=1 Tax=Lasiodiplodia mahajangana TaxID=1108764 RepID=A0ACC2JIS7_9PEZI|nr:hypothetical protein O1611_g6287 [Lasiodiplodia mahajangana]